MKPIKSLVLLGTLAAIPALAPSDALAQPGYGPGPGYYAAPPPNSQLPGGFHNRQGRLIFGGSAGLGGMNDDFGDVGCNGCSALSGQLAGHIGGFIGPRLALMFEGQMNVQQISQEQFVEDDAFLYQSAAMIAAQYWLTPQLWLKGGIGFAHLEIDSRDGFFVTDIENGTAILGAVGFEVFSARYMSIDLQGRLLNGSYEGIDNNITAASVGVGINWF